MTPVLEALHPVAKLQRALQTNHAGHEVLRSSAIGFFDDVRQNGGKDVAVRERFITAFKAHFRTDAPTEYGMHGDLERCFPANYTCAVGTNLLQNFTMRAVLVNGECYDFSFTL